MAVILKWVYLLSDKNQQVPKNYHKLMYGKLSFESTESISCNLTAGHHSWTLVDKYHCVPYIADYL